VTHPRRRIDLSADLGEAESAAHLASEEALWPLITSANVACGGHAGDVLSMAAAVERAIRHGVAIGAHPSYPDRATFGRISLPMDQRELVESLVGQIGALYDLAAASSIRLRHVKAHGALYNDAHRNLELAAALVEAIRQVDPSMAIVASAASNMRLAADRAGTSVIREAFADRRYRPDGGLVPRSEPDALLIDVEEAAAQAASLVETGTLVAQNGERIRVEFDTLCVHADMENAVERAQAIRDALGMTAACHSE
jgi:5-oxoprolinase (ATP-hydrolysing) subunit A